MYCGQKCVLLLVALPRLTQLPPLLDMSSVAIMERCCQRPTSLT
jgi:hypothetical protein